MFLRDKRDAELTAADRASRAYIDLIMSGVARLGVGKDEPVSTSGSSAISQLNPSSRHALARQPQW